MARTQRTWADLRADIYLHLKELENSSFWTPAHLLMLFNEEKDALEMILEDQHEGFSVETYTADIVADQAQYSLPTQAGRVKKISRVYTSINREIPLTRAERRTAPMNTGSTGRQAVPNYRLVGHYILLEPTPGEAETGGLKIEIEVASDRFSGDDNDTLPLSWPIFTETYLVLHTAQAALADEEGQDLDPNSEPVSNFLRRVRRYDALLEEYTHRRSYGIQFATPYRQGG